MIGYYEVSDFLEDALQTFAKEDLGKLYEVNE